MILLHKRIWYISLLSLQRDHENAAGKILANFLFSTENFVFCCTVDKILWPCLCMYVGALASMHSVSFSLSFGLCADCVCLWMGGWVRVLCGYVSRDNYGALSPARIRHLVWPCSYTASDHYQFPHMHVTYSMSAVCTNSKTNGAGSIEFCGKYHEQIFNNILCVRRSAFMLVMFLVSVFCMRLLPLSRCHEPIPDQFCGLYARIQETGFK